MNEYLDKMEKEETKNVIYEICINIAFFILIAIIMIILDK